MLLTETTSAASTLLVDLPAAAYVHIPFCRRRCFYCDFPIAVVGDRLRGNDSGTICQYVEVLCQEICLTPQATSPLETVFFGGGTPSLLSAGQLSQILETLEQQFGLAPQAEISMEIDPATFDLAQVQGYRAAGVNRVSLGAQAFQPALLQVAGRSHISSDIYTAVELLHQAGFTNISLDLISGLPHQTLADWQDSLERAIAIDPTHISCYDLTVEAGTAFGRQYKPGLAPLPSDDTTAAMYRTAHAMLTTAGYDHYEISNFGKPGAQCRHNRGYWQNQPFYGFGMGATSYLAGDRLSRPRKTPAYYQWVNALQTTGIQRNEQTIPTNDVLLDTLMLGLRLAEGIDLVTLSDRFGVASDRIEKCLHRFQHLDWFIFEETTAPVSAKRLALTQPEGFLFSNVLLVALFEEFEK